MEKNTRKEHHILDTILRQLIKSDDVFNVVGELLTQNAVFVSDEELHLYLNKLVKNKFIEEKYVTAPDGRKEPSDPRRHKITTKGAEFIKKNSFSGMGREKERRRKKEDHLLNLRLFRNWIWILISVPSILYTLNALILKICHVDVFRVILSFLKSLVSQ